MTKNTKIALGLVVAAVVLYFLLRPSSKAEDRPEWNRHETPTSAAAVGVFGLDWG